MVAGFAFIGNKNFHYYQRDYSVRGRKDTRVLYPHLPNTYKKKPPDNSIIIPLKEKTSQPLS